MTDKYLDLYCEVMKLRRILLSMNICPECEGHTNERMKEDSEGVISFYAHCCQCDKKWRYDGEEI